MCKLSVVLMYACCIFGNTLTVEKNPGEEVATVAQLEDLRVLVNEQTRALQHFQAELGEKDRRIRELEKAFYLQSLTETTSGKEKRAAQNRCQRAAFSSYLDHDTRQYNISVLKTVVFNKVLYNEGNGYNSKTGKFTCPVTGVYFFIFYVAEWGPGQILVRLLKDGHNVVDGVTNPVNVTTHANPHDQQGGNAAIIKCSKGSNVWLQTYFDFNKHPQRHLHSRDGVRFCTFSGVLMYRT